MFAQLRPQKYVISSWFEYFLQWKTLMWKWSFLLIMHHNTICQIIAIWCFSSLTCRADTWLISHTECRNMCIASACSHLTELWLRLRFWMQIAAIRRRSVLKYPNCLLSRVSQSPLQLLMILISVPDDNNALPVVLRAPVAPVAFKLTQYDVSPSRLTGQQLSLHHTSDHSHKNERLTNSIRLRKGLGIKEMVCFSQWDRFSIVILWTMSKFSNLDL